MTLILLSTLALVGCSDTGLNSVPKDPPEATDTCECPDNSAEVTELQEELASLRDRVGTLESEPEPEVPTSALVVTEYDVDCLNQPVKFDYYYFDGEAYPLNYLASGDFAEGDRTAGCVWAKIDPLDPPMFMTNSYFEDMRLTSQGWPNNTSYLWSNFGNNWYFRPVLGETGSLNNVQVNEDGFVFGSTPAGAPWQRDCSAYTDPDGDCPWTSPLLHVVIFDDKPALRPEAW